MSRWFRYYDEALNDLKVQRLPGGLFKAWVNLMCLTSKTDGEGFSVGDIAFALRLTPAKAQAIADQLIERELLDDTETGLVSHNFAERQFKSDVTDPTAADRMRRYRKRNGSVTEKTVTVTPTRAETEQIQSRTDQKRKSAAGAALPADWQPTVEDFEYGRQLGFSDPQVLGMAEDMRLWARGNDNRSITKKSDWASVFRGWMRRESKKGHENGPDKSLSAAARRMQGAAIAFGPRPGSEEQRAGGGADSNIVRLLPEG